MTESDPIPFADFDRHRTPALSPRQNLDVMGLVALIEGARSFHQDFPMKRLLLRMQEAGLGTWQDLGDGQTRVTFHGVSASGRHWDEIAANWVAAARQVVW